MATINKYLIVIAGPTGVGKTALAVKLAKYFNTEIISTIFKHATVGVSYFFILSGFVMIIAYGRKAEINKADYFKNRVARIYPVYLLAIILLFIHFAFVEIQAAKPKISPFIS